VSSLLRFTASEPPSSLPSGIPAETAGLSVSTMAVSSLNQCSTELQYVSTPRLLEIDGPSLKY
jgi:hypothetical protein